MPFLTSDELLNNDVKFIRYTKIPTKDSIEYILRKKMISYVNINLKTEFSTNVLYENFSKEFPDFHWRCGDSDLQGTYISGMNKEKIRIQIWDAVSPAEMSVSFTGSQLSEVQRNFILVDLIYKFIPLIGKLIKVEYF